MNKQKKETSMEKSKPGKLKPRPRNRKFMKVSTGLIYRTLKNLDPAGKADFLREFPDVVHDLGCDLADWASDKISDKAFCGRLFNHWHNLVVLFDMLRREKEVAEFIEDQVAYDEEYARRNPESEEPEMPF